MSRLENLIPPLELCKQIPAGEFDDSALAWYNFHGVPILRWRDNLEKLDGVRPIPAPTLEEILEAIREIQLGNQSYCYPTESEEALRLWFKVKGIKIEI